MLQEFLDRAKAGEPIAFEETMKVIEAHYEYHPAAFDNGVGENRLENAAGSNEGSCKIFAFAKLNGLSETQTLNLFGDYYRRDVLEEPNGTGHGNIRNFMKYGWQGIVFHGTPLKPR